MNTPFRNEIHTVSWQGDSEGYLKILDQTALPTAVKYVACKDVPSVIESIKMLRVRGAPAIGALVEEDEEDEPEEFGLYVLKNSIQDGSSEVGSDK